MDCLNLRLRLLVETLNTLSPAHYADSQSNQGRGAVKSSGLMVGGLKRQHAADINYQLQDQE